MSACQHVTMSVSDVLSKEQSPVKPDQRAQAVSRTPDSAVDKEISHSKASENKLPCFTNLFLKTFIFLNLIKSK